MRASSLTSSVALASALLLGTRTPAAAQAGGAVPAVAPPDSAPAVWGVRLGDSAARVDSVLGAPASQERLVADAVLRRYPDRDLEVVTTGDQGVAMLRCVGPRAEVAGVRVGMSEPDVLARWGEPYRRYADGGVGFKAATWGAVVRFAPGVPGAVREIQLGLLDPRR